ncbi:MAG: glycosyltransferase family 2 protein [Verrucomicrobiota bacterium]|nr:glycosyltransferase family 2 protein [Verrucomicrobiota bacterium]
MKIAIYIPAYNAASTITRVLDRIPDELKRSVEEIFVVDNASEDNTHLVAIGYGHVNSLHTLKVFRNGENLGYGGSQKWAYNYCIERGFDAVVMLHGDAQYAPEKVSFLLEPIVSMDADLVFGSRIAGEPLKGSLDGRGMPIHRYLGNRVLTAIQNRILGWNLSEYHSGFRVFRCSALKEVGFEHCSNYYHFDTEILIRFKLFNKKVVERPIPTYYGSEKFHGDIWVYGLRVLHTMFKYLMTIKGFSKDPRFLK